MTPCDSRFSKVINLGIWPFWPFWPFVHFGTLNPPISTFGISDPGFVVFTLFALRYKYTPFQWSTVHRTVHRYTDPDLGPPDGSRDPQNDPFWTHFGPLFGPIWDPLFGPLFGTRGRCGPSQGAATRASPGTPDTMGLRVSGTDPKRGRFWGLWLSRPPKTAILGFNSTGNAESANIPRWV